MCGLLASGQSMGGGTEDRECSGFGLTVPPDHLCQTPC